MTPAELAWAAALISGFAAVLWQGHRQALGIHVLYWTAVAALCGGLAGGVLFGLHDYGVDDSWNPLTRGKSFCGGLAGGALAAAGFLWCRKVSIPKYGDILVTGLALGYAIGRIGCFLNGCDFGTVTRLPWAVRYPPGTEAYADHLERGWITPEHALSLPVHPVQLYAAAAGLVMFLVLSRWKPAWPGQRIWLFALFYGVYRFCIEWLRGDFRSFAGPFSLPQVVAILLITGALAVWCWRRWRSVAAGRSSTPCPSAQCQSTYLDHECQSQSRH